MNFITKRVTGNRDLSGVGFDVRNFSCRLIIHKLFRCVIDGPSFVFL